MAENHERNSEVIQEYKEWMFGPDYTSEEEALADTVISKVCDCPLCVSYQKWLDK